MNDLWHDLRYALRILAKSRGFTLIAVVTLALGIGANTAVFSVADALILKPLHLQDPKRLVYVGDRRADMKSGWIPSSPGRLADLASQSHSFEKLSPYACPGYSLNATSGYGGQPERLDGCAVAPDFFDTLGVKPVAGRTFASGEDQIGRHLLVVLSHGLWERRFGADRAVVGKEVQINERTFTIAGVMTPDFNYPPGTQLWVPLAMSDQRKANRFSHDTWSVARLKPGVSPAQANRELDAIALQLEKKYPRTDGGWRSTVIPLHDFVKGDSYTVLLLGVAGFVLLIACANVANLQFARSTGRSREIAVRAALGASRWRMLRQLLTESVALSLLGALAGLLLANWGIDFIRSYYPAEIMRGSYSWHEIALDGRALAFAAAIAVISGILSGLAPALCSGRPRLGQVLKDGGWGATAGRSRQVLRSGLATVEIALALVLVTGTGLVVKGFVALLDKERNVQADSLLTMRLDLPLVKYAELPRVGAFWKQVVERLEALPGVQSAAVSSMIPHSGFWGGINFFSREDNELPGVERIAYLQTVSPDYLRAARVPLLRGRALNRHDGPEAQPVSLISDSMARRFWPGEDPLGKRFKFGYADSRNPWITVVGVVGDVLYNTFDQEPRPSMYLPVAQSPQRGMHILLRTSGDPAALANAVRAEIQRLDPMQPVYQVKTMQRLIDEGLMHIRLLSILMVIFGGLALVVASVGVYGGWHGR